MILFTRCRVFFFVLDSTRGGRQSQNCTLSFFLRSFVFLPLLLFLYMTHCPATAPLGGQREIKFHDNLHQFWMVYSWIGIKQTLSWKNECKISFRLENMAKMGPNSSKRGQKEWNPCILQSMSIWMSKYICIQRGVRICIQKYYKVNYLFI